MRALVRDHYYEAQKKITVTLAGDNKKGFLEIIRKSLHEIHHTFHELAVEEWVPCNCAQCQTARQPEFFKVERLEHYQRGGKPTITCDNSLQEVNIQRLLNDVFLPPKREEEEEDDFRRELLARGGTYVDRRIQAGGDVIFTEIGDDVKNVAVGREIDQQIDEA